MPAAHLERDGLECQAINGVKVWILGSGKKGAFKKGSRKKGASSAAARALYLPVVHTVS